MLPRRSLCKRRLSGVDSTLRLVGRFKPCCPSAPKHPVINSFAERDAAVRYAGLHLKACRYTDSACLPDTTLRTLCMQVDNDCFLSTFLADNIYAGHRPCSGDHIAQWQAPAYLGTCQDMQLWGTLLCPEDPLPSCQTGHAKPASSCSRCRPTSCTTLLSAHAPS